MDHAISKNHMERAGCPNIAVDIPHIGKKIFLPRSRVERPRKLFARSMRLRHHQDEGGEIRWKKMSTQM